MLLPAVTADGQSGDEAIAGMNACCPSGMSLLHVAVGTGSVPLVRELAAWAAGLGYCWEVDARGGNSGITPLHVAALLPNSKDMRAALAGEAGRGGSGRPVKGGSTSGYSAAALRAALSCVRIRKPAALNCQLLLTVQTDVLRTFLFAAAMPA